MSIGTRPTTSSTTVVFSSTVTATNSPLAVATTGKAAETTTATTIKLMSTPSKEPSTITRIATSQAWTEEQGPDLGTTSSRGRSTTGKTASTTSTGEISSPGTKAAEPSTWQTTQSVVTTMETTEPVTTKTRGWTEVTTRRSTKGNGPTMGGQTEGPTTGAEEVETLMTDWTEVITTAPVERTTEDAATTAKVATGPTHTEVITTGPSRLPETTASWTEAPTRESGHVTTAKEIAPPGQWTESDATTGEGWTEVKSSPEKQWTEVPSSASPLSPSTSTEPVTSTWTDVSTSIGTEGVVTYDTTTVPDKETVEPRTEVEVDRTRTTAGEESITEKGWTEAIPEGGTDASTTPQNAEYTTLSWTQMEEDRTTKATEKGDLTTGEQWTEGKTASTPSVHVTGEVTTAQQETTRDHFTEVTTEGDTAATTVEQWTDVPSTASQLPTSVEEETSTWTEAISGEVMTTVRQDLATTPPTEVTLKPWTEAESTKTSTSELTTEEGWAEATTEGDAEAVTFGTSKNVEHTTGSWTEVDRDGTTMVTEGVDPTTGKQWTEVATASTPDVLTTTEEKMTQPPFTAVPIEENTTPTTVELWTEVTSTELQNLTDEVTSVFTEAPSMVTREDVTTPITGQTLKPWTEVDTTLAPTEEEPTTGETWTDATAGGGTEAVTFGTFQKDEYTTGAWTEIGRDSTTMIPEGVDLTTAALYGDMTTIPDETTHIPFTEVTIEETPTTVEQRAEIPIEISTEPFSESFTTGKGWTEDEVETTKSGVEEEMTTRKWTEVKGETTVEQWTEKTGATTTGAGEEGTEGGRTEETAETIWTTAAEASEELTTGEQGTTGRGWTEVDAGEPTTVSEPEWTAAAGKVTSASSWTEMRTEVPTAVPEATTAVDWTEGENEEATTAENRAEGKGAMSISVQLPVALGGVTTADQSWTEAPYSVNVTEDGTPPPNDPVVALLLA